MTRTTVLDLEGPGGHLIMSAALQPVPGAAPLVDVHFHLSAHPFQGAFSELMMVEDLVFFRDNLRRLTPSGQVTFGGERAPELTLTVEPQTGVADGSCVVEVSATPSSDDPWPRLTYLIFGVQPFADVAAAALDALLEGVE